MKTRTGAAPVGFAWLMPKGAYVSHCWQTGSDLSVCREWWQQSLSHFVSGDRAEHCQACLKAEPLLGAPS